MASNRLATGQADKEKDVVTVKAMIKSFALAVAVVVGLITGLVVTAPAATAAPSPATASVQVSARFVGPVPTVSYRPGAGWGQIDILMDEVETERVAKSFWGGSVVCWPAAVGGFAGGPAGSVAAYSGCITMATVCAARAYLSQPRKRAAITMTIWGYGWCWKY